MSTEKPQPPLYGRSLTLEQARKVSAAAQHCAFVNGWPMVVAVMDAGGHLVLLAALAG